MDSQVFSKIWIVVILIILIVGGIFAWQYFWMPEKGVKAPEIKTLKVKTEKLIDPVAYAVTCPGKVSFYENQKFGTPIDTETKIYTVHLDGSHKKMIFSDKNYDFFYTSPESLGYITLIGPNKFGPDKIAMPVRDRKTGEISCKQIDIESGKTSQCLRGNVSPDGKKIAYATSSDLNSIAAIFVANIDGINPQKIFEYKFKDEGSIRDLTWSPDGEKIGFVLSETQAIGLAEGEEIPKEKSYVKETLYIINIDGTNLKKVIGGEGKYIHWPQWSPKGDRFLLTLNGKVVTIDLEGKIKKEFRERGYFPKWSPDGKNIFFSDSIDAGAKLYVMDTDTREIQFIISSEEEGEGCYIEPILIYYALSVPETVNCEEIQDSSLKSECYLVLAKETKDKTYCEKIPTEYSELKRECYRKAERKTYYSPDRKTYRNEKYGFEIKYPKDLES